MISIDTEAMVNSVHVRVRPPLTKPQQSVIAAAVGIVVAIGAVFVSSPGIRGSMLQEDGPVETLTALTFLVSAAIGVWRWVRSRHPSWSWVVPVAALVGFLDEVSFGARVFGWSPPRVSGIDVDSLHDIFDLTERWAEGAGLGRTHLALMALVVLVGVFGFLVAGDRWRRVSHWLRVHPPVAWLAAASALLFGGIALDLVGTSQVLRLAEESLEFTAGVLVLSGVLAIGLGERPS